MAIMARIKKKIRSLYLGEIEVTCTKPHVGTLCSVLHKLCRQFAILKKL